MEALCYRFPIRPGMTPEVEAFFKDMAERAPEIHAALKAAGLTSQSVMIVPTLERDYLVFFNQGPNLTQAVVQQLKSELPIDAELWEVLGRTVIIEEGLSLPLLMMWRDDGRP